MAVAVPFGLGSLVPSVPGECGTTLDRLAFHAGLAYFAGKSAWAALKGLSDAAERWLDRRARPDPVTPRRTSTP